MPAPLLEVLHRADLARLGFRDEDARDFRALVATLPQHPHRLDQVNTLAGLLRPTIGDPFAEPPVAPHRGLEALEDGIVTLLALVAIADDAHAEYVRRGIPTDVAWRSLSDLGQQVHIFRKAFGHFGFVARAWCAANFTGRHLWLGRLQYTIEREPDGVVVGVHVPETGPLTPADVDASLAEAATVLPAAFPEHRIERATIQSWMLDPLILAGLHPESNLVRFAERFELTREVGDGWRDLLYFGFHVEPRLQPVDLAGLPDGTSLHRAMIRRLERGGARVFHGVLRDSPFPATAAPSVGVSEPLRVGVVGLGMRARLAAHVEKVGNDGVVVGACDPDPAARGRSLEFLGKDPATFPVVGSVRELIALGIDAAFVTSPDDTHARVTTELLEAGVAVYLEKPIATTLEDSTRVLEAAHISGTKLYVGHNMRHMAFVRKMRRLILAGAIGEVQSIWCRHFVGNGGDFYFKDWHADRRHSNGLLLQKAAHDIDVMHWLAGSEATEVVGMGDLMVYRSQTARGARRGQMMREWFSLENWPPDEQGELNEVVDVEDVSMLMMRMRSGVLASYQQCHFTPDYWRNYTVIGTRGRIENFGDGDGGVIRLWNRRAHYNPDGDEQFPIRGDAHGHNDADAITVAEFLRFVRTSAPTDTSPLGAWHAVAAGIAATDSLRDGSTPRGIPTLSPDLVDYFTNHQRR